MPIYEIRDPKPIPTGDRLQPRRRDVKPVSPAEKSRPIDLLQLPYERGREQQEEWHQRDQTEQAGVERSAKTIIRHINGQLEILKVEIHLALFKDEEGYTLDVHDCRNGIVCEKVAETPIDIAALPDLLNRLKQQAGILFDSKL